MRSVFCDRRLRGPNTHRMSEQTKQSSPGCPVRSRKHTATGLDRASSSRRRKGRFDHFASGQRQGLCFGARQQHGRSDRTLRRNTYPPNHRRCLVRQGVAFSPEANKLFVASEKGKVYIYDGDSFKLLSTLDFEGGADNMRYDAATKRVYVGCGDDEKNSGHCSHRRHDH